MAALEHEHEHEHGEDGDDGELAVLRAIYDEALTPIDGDGAGGTYPLRDGGFKIRLSDNCSLCVYYADRTAEALAGRDAHAPPRYAFEWVRRPLKGVAPEIEEAMAAMHVPLEPVVHDWVEYLRETELVRGNGRGAEEQEHDHRAVPGSCGAKQHAQHRDEDPADAATVGGSPCHPDRQRRPAAAEGLGGAVVDAGQQHRRRGKGNPRNPPCAPGLPPLRLQDVLDEAVCDQASQGQLAEHQEGVGHRDAHCPRGLASA